jgi:hypothetical protein
VRTRYCCWLTMCLLLLLLLLLQVVDLCLVTR